MKRERVIQLVALGMFGASISVAGLLGTKLSASAGRNQLVYTARGVDGQPIESGLGIAMGPFRGLLVNFLWIRANQMKEAGKVYESLNLAKAITAMHDAPGDAWTLDTLAARAGMSRARFAAHFHHVVGLTPGHYLTRWRVNLAGTLIARGQPINVVAGHVGYGSATALSRAFRAHTGHAPSAWRKQHS